MVRPARVSSKIPTVPGSATFQKFLDAAPDAMVILDRHGRIAYTNAQVRRLLGYDASELLGQAVEVLLPLRLRATHAAYRDRYLEAPVSRPMGQGRELVGLHKDGTEIPVEISLSAVATEQGPWVLGAIRDIRERKRDEAKRAHLLSEVSRARRHAQTQAREARRAADRLRALLDTLPAGVVFADAEGTIVLRNATANEMFGDATAGTAYGPASPDTLHHLDGSPFPSGELPLPRAIEEGETTHDVAIVVRSESGDERVILVAATPQRDRDGQIIGAIAVFQDVTGRERDQQALREHNERLRLITANSPDMMSYQDQRLRYRWVVNPVPPFTEETMLGKTDCDILPPDQAISFIKVKREVMASGVGTSMVVARECQGARHFYEIVLEPRRDLSGNVDGIFGYLRDVTERKRAEEETARLTRTIEAERSLLRTILDSANNAIIHVDAATGHVLANPEAEQLFGHPFTPEAGRDQYIGQIRDREGHIVPRPDLPTSRALHGETPPRQELLVARPDGAMVPVLENVAPIRTPEGHMVGAVVVFQDISALRELERLREEWTSVIAHDLRQPVTLIHGYAELLGKEIMPTSALGRAYYVDCIRTSAQQLNRMIADLLDVSRLEARRLALERRPVDLGDLVRDVVARAAPVTSGHRVRLTVHGAIPPVDADPGRIEQVLVNLLSNAAKYGRAACPIEVRVEAGPSDVQVAVSNAGPGIPPDELRTLFTRFCRTRSGRAKKAPGIGLGLYIAKGLVEAHGGRIWAESVPDDKTTFGFTLPFPTA
jgi:PAS domain S-box-containing protein